MKNITLILALLFVGVTASANTSKSTFAPYNYGEAFIFVEGGVEFAVYPNGEFDFHYNPQFLNTSIVHIPNPGRNISYNSGYNYDAFIQYDDFGAVIQIENVPVYYDFYGRLIQAGNVTLRYDNHGRIVRVGGMNIRYNRFNQPIRYVGMINHYNTRYIYRPWHQYYMRPHQNYRVVYFEPYRAYYEPVRMNYIQYTNYYQNNNYYYNKSNFYRPGQQVASYNYGRRTTTARDLNEVVRSSENVSRNSTAVKTDNASVRNNNTVTRTAAENSTYSTTNDVTRQRSMEQHEAAVRAQRGSINTAVVPTQTRGAVNTSTRSTTVDPVQTRSSTAAPVQTKTVQRPEAVTRTSVPRAQSTAGRSSVQRSTNNTTAVNERSQNTPVSRTVKPTVRETSGTVRSSGRG
ncbi:MAG: hypothetical protein ABJ092_09555 [Gillisia sp.]